MGVHHELTLKDRVRIETILADGKDHAWIATQLSTIIRSIRRELNRVPEDLFYNAEHAQADRDHKKHHCGTHSKWTPKLMASIDSYLRKKWSPAQIAQQIKLISEATIYRWLTDHKVTMTRKSLRFKGRKRHSNEHRGKMKVIQEFEMVQQVMADGGYTSDNFASIVRATIGADVIIAKQIDLKHGVVTPQRWIVERSFSWLGKWRRLWRNCERKLTTSRIMVALAFLGMANCKMKRNKAPIKIFL